MCGILIDGDIEGEGKTGSLSLHHLLNHLHGTKVRCPYLDLVSASLKDACRDPAGLQILVHYLIIHIRTSQVKAHRKSCQGCESFRADNSGILYPDPPYS